MIKTTLVLFTVILSRKIEENENGDFIVSKKVFTNELNFMLLGDWGGWPAPVYNTPIQLQVANSMERTAKTWKPEFIYGMGDNFYFWGVDSVTNEMFMKTFENIYRSEELQCDWHFTTGNHDWDDGNGTVQLEYSEISHRWTYPAFHYAVDYELADGTTMRLITVDSPMLCGVH